MLGLVLSCSHRSQLCGLRTLASLALSSDDIAVQLLTPALTQHLQVWLPMYCQLHTSLRVLLKCLEPILNIVVSSLWIQSSLIWCWKVDYRQEEY